MGCQRAIAKQIVEQGADYEFSGDRSFRDVVLEAGLTVA